MIRRTVSAAFLLRDAFTGQTFRDCSSTRCMLDGRPLLRPVWKRDGYLVLTDLAPGEHVLCVSRNGYRDELVRVLTKEDAYVEDTISLKPGAGYRFPPDTVRVSISLKSGGKAAPGAEIWLGMLSRTQLKLAQEKAESGDTQAHLFCDGNAALLPIPGHFLLADKSKPELVYLRSLRNETGEFSPPLKLDHGRGTLMIPMQTYRADETGCVQVLLREPGTLTGFCADKVYTAQLNAGEQDVVWKLEG